MSISKRVSVKDYFYDLSSTLLIPGSNHQNIYLPMEARPESGISLGDTEEVRGQIYSHPDFQVFIACHVADIVFAVDNPWVGLAGWLQRIASIPCIFYIW